MTLGTSGPRGQENIGTSEFKGKKKHFFNFRFSDSRSWESKKRVFGAKKTFFISKIRARTVESGGAKRHQ